MRKFDLSLRSSRSSYFATFRHQLTILSKTDALDEEKWLNMLGTFVKDWFRYESHFVHGRDSLVDILKERGLLSDRKSGSAGMPRPISYAVFCLKKKNVAENYPLPRDTPDDPEQLTFGRDLRSRRTVSCLDPPFIISQT